MHKIRIFYEFTVVVWEVLYSRLPNNWNQVYDYSQGGSMFLKNTNTSSNYIES